MLCILSNIMFATSSKLMYLSKNVMGYLVQDEARQAHLFLYMQETRKRNVILIWFDFSLPNLFFQNFYYRCCYEWRLILFVSKFFASVMQSLFQFISIEIMILTSRKLQKKFLGENSKIPNYVMSYSNKIIWILFFLRHFKI